MSHLAITYCRLYVERINKGGQMAKSTVTKKSSPPSRQDREDRGKRSVAINFLTTTEIRQMADELAEEDLRSLTATIEVLIRNEWTKRQRAKSKG